MGPFCIIRLPKDSGTVTGGWSCAVELNVIKYSHEDRMNQNKTRDGHKIVKHYLTDRQIETDR